MFDRIMLTRLCGVDIDWPACCQLSEVCCQLNKVIERNSVDQVMCTFGWTE